MDTPDGPRTRPATADTGEPHETRQPPATSLDPRLTWPRPYVEHPADGPRSASRRMPRFSPRHNPAPPDYDPAEDAPAPPLPQRPHARPAPSKGGAPLPPPSAVSRGQRPQPARAIIGDEIRIPFIWCEFGTCDATYIHPDALGERDLRNRALAAGWRYDMLGRRACPSCAQHDPTFWTAPPPAPVPGDWRRAG